ncbi:tyrosine-type recombinase/integrase [Rugamonas aquatica]|uniref:Tyrosine-type recombinase/integrase n=1 Tax=Rugamonas aquatica TaxID=2743357 RepID=A0A6A7N6X7_9BURK|nr:site-specific integrase [Rugamonas aquatica]MQA40642.1 tyrosine-type recombinase/integrase [Rugamonas aquatica]
MTMREPALAQQLLIEVVNGANFSQVASSTGLGRSAVVQQVKSLARSLQTVVGVINVDEGAEPTLTLLQREGAHYLEALGHFRPELALTAQPQFPVATSAQIRALVAYADRASSEPIRDRALLLLLFATGARPDEIASLRIRDYMLPRGTIRQQSVLRAEAASNGRERPLYFVHARTNAAIDAYLDQRLKLEGSPRNADATPMYRGLNPDSALFVNQEGRPLQQGRCYGADSIQGIYRHMFRGAGLNHFSPMGARRTLARHLYRHGLDEQTISNYFGFSSLWTVRNLLRGYTRPLEQTLQVFP